MKLKLAVTVFSMVIVLFLMGSQGKDVRGNHDSISAVELPAPPPPPDTILPDEDIDESELSRVMATAGNDPSWWSAGGKSWVNYDFKSQSISKTNVDWPIMIIFYGNATVNKVKSIYGGITLWGSTMYGAYNIGNGTQWDSDRGTKVTVSFGGPDGYDSDTLHLRIYAPSSTDYFDGDAGWGHYVIASAHFDFNPPWDSIVGYSEDAEHAALQIASSKGYTVYYDWSWIGNYESLRNESNHWWQSDGYVSLVYVP
jgi:hypothetical protein